MWEQRKLGIRRGKCTREQTTIPAWLFTGIVTRAILFPRLPRFPFVIRAGFKTSNSQIPHIKRISCRRSSPRVRLTSPSSTSRQIGKNRTGGMFGVRIFFHAPFAPSLTGGKCGPSIRGIHRRRKIWGRKDQRRYVRKCECALFLPFQYRLE